jgi:hypothetical protein
VFEEGIRSLHLHVSGVAEKLLATRAVLVPLIAAHRSREPALQTARQSKARFQKESENGRDQSPCSRGQARRRTAID